MRFLLFLLFCSPALAGPPHWCVTVLIDFKSDGMMDAAGSGSLILPKYVITNYHVIESQCKYNTVYVRFPDWSYVKGKVVKTDKLADLALIKVPITYRNPVKLGKSCKLGDKVTIMGYGQGLWEEGEAEIFETGGRGSRLDMFIDCKGFSASLGSSGGPILNEDKELIGVLWGSDDNGTLGVRIREILKFIEGYYAP